MKWFKRFMVAVMLLALLATTMVYLTPLDVYVPEVEQTLSENFGEPVKVGHLKLSLFPLPHLELEAVEMGRNADATVQAVGVFFDLRSLLKPQRVIQRLVLDQGRITQDHLLGIMGMLHSGKVPVKLLRLDELQFNGIQLVIPGVDLATLEGKLELMADGSLKQAWVTTSDQKMAALVYPLAGGAFQVNAGFRAWSPPGYPALVIDRLNASGILTDGRFDAGKFEAEMFGAQISGSAHVGWQPAWKMDVRFDRADGELGRLLPLLGYPVEASGMLHAKGRLAAHGSSMRALPGSLNFDADVAADTVVIRLPLKAQRMLTLDSASAHVAGTPQKFILDNFVGRLYDGAWHGNAMLQPADGLLDAELAFSNISAQPLVESLSDEVLLTGTLGGRTKLSARLKEFGRFPGNVQVDSDFHLKNGVLGKVDLVQAASNPLKDGNKGGKTRFDELSGLLSVDGNGYHLTRLKVSSGAVDATGKLEISPQLQLSGLLDTELKGTASLVSMPLVVSGTVREPVLRPPGSTIAGAAVGTALLGPGLGTALGIKVGNLLNRIFGTKDKNQPAEQKNSAVPPDSGVQQNKK